MASGMKGLLDWSRRQVVGYPAVEVTNFTTSWRDGLAFCALIHRYRPDLIDFHSLKPENVLENNELAFHIAEKELDISALLDADDMLRMRVPDRLSVATYVSQFYNHLYKLAPEGGPDVRSYKAKRPLSADENEEPPELRRKVTQEKPQPAVRQSLGDSCAHCGKKVYLLERHIVGPKLYHRVCYRRLTPGSHPKSPLSNYENSVLGAQDRNPGLLNRGTPDVRARTSLTQQSAQNDHKDRKHKVEDDGSEKRNSLPDTTKPKSSAGLPSWFKGPKGAKNKTSTEDLPNNKLRLSDEYDATRTAKLKENAVFNDLGAISSMNNTSSGELELDNADAGYVSKQPVFPKVPNVDKNSPKAVKKKEKRFLDFRSMSNDSLLTKKNTNIIKKEQERSVDSDSGSSARARASAHWSTSSLDNPLTSSRLSMTSHQSTDSIKSPVNQSPSTNHAENVQSFVPISALISTPTPYGQDAPDGAVEPVQDPNQNTKTSPADKTIVKPPIPVQPHFDPFDEVVDTPEREAKITQAKSNTYVPDHDDKLPDATLPWLAKVDDDDMEVDETPVEDRGAARVTSAENVASTQNRPESRKLSMDYPEELNPFAGEEDEPDKYVPSGFVNAQSPFKTCTVRNIRTASSPRRKRAAPTLPSGARLSTRSEPGEGSWNQTGKRASLPAQVDSLEFKLSPSAQRSGVSPSASPRREKRPAPKPPVATPRVSLLNKDKNVNSKDNLLRAASEEKKDIIIVSNDLSASDASDRTMETGNRAAKGIDAPTSLPLGLADPSTMKRVRLSKQFDFSRVSMDSDQDSPTKADSDIEDLLNEIDLNAVSPMSPDNPIGVLLEQGRMKTKKPAPPKPVPPKRKINLGQKVPSFEIEKELVDIEKTLDELEARGRIMEDSIRLGEEFLSFVNYLNNQTNSADEEASGEDETEMIRWFELVNEKNALVRREQELTYILREQDLEEDHEDIEHELRQLMAIQEQLKTTEDRARENELLDRLLQIVNERNMIVHSIDDDRIRYEEEDRVIAATLAESFSKQTLNSSPSKSSGSLSSSPKMKKKEKKEKKKHEKKEKKKEDKRKGSIFSCVSGRKASSTFYPNEKPTEELKTDAEKTSEQVEPFASRAVSARQHGSAFYRDVDDVKI